MGGVLGCCFYASLCCNGKLFGSTYFCVVKWRRFNTRKCKQIIYISSSSRQKGKRPKCEQTEHKKTPPNSPCQLLLETQKTGVVSGGAAGTTTNDARYMLPIYIFFLLANSVLYSGTTFIIRTFLYPKSGAATIVWAFVSAIYPVSGGQLLLRIICRLVGRPRRQSFCVLVLQV